MTNKELLEKISEDIALDRGRAEKISDEINDELKKKKPDYDKIAELSKQYCEIIGADEEIDSSSEEHCKAIIVAARNYSPRKRILRRFIGIAASLLFILVSANCYTVSALKMNIFKAIVHYANGGFSVDFTSDTETNDDPYGIKAECAKYGIYPEVPTYLPEGFELYEVNYDELGKDSVIDFLFHKDNMTIDISYDMFSDLAEMSKVGYPSDYYNISEIEINGSSAVVSKEDGQFTLVYAKGNILMSIFTTELNYEECDKIVDSIK